MEVVGGVTGTILFGAGSMIAHGTGRGSKWFDKRTLESLAHTGLGIAGTAFSIANIATLGFVGYKANHQ